MNKSHNQLIAVKKFPHILAALNNQPWAITEAWLSTICGIVEAHAAGNTPEFAAAMKRMQDDDDGDEDDLQMEGNVAVIPVMGPIFPRANLMTALSGATASSDISRKLDLAVDRKPDAVVMQYDSPGGAVPGGFEVSDKIYNIRQSGIPIIACVEGCAASLAYLWASQCDQVCVSQASVVGSVSVVMRMMSDDRAMRNEGVDVVTMKSGTLKQAGDPAALAFAGQYASLLGQLNTYHDMFVENVRRARPMMDMGKVSTGDVWIGQKAVESGLADRVCTMAQVMAELA